jgi:hypothetical protein
MSDKGRGSKKPQSKKPSTKKVDNGELSEQELDKASGGYGAISTGYSSQKPDGTL